MDCCGHGHALAPRHWMSSTALTSVGAMLAGDVGPRGSTAAAQTAETASAALDVLRKSISVDVHTHGGQTGITSKASPNDDLANAMRAGSLAVACLADVPDGPVLGRNTEGVLAAVRAPEPGQLYRHHLERLAWMDEMVANHGLRRALSATDLEAAHKAGHPAIIADVEGSTLWRQGSNDLRKRINAASGTYSSCITRPTTLAISRPARSCTRKRRKSGSQLTPCWREESAANSSLKCQIPC
jgi:hypothetical protein